MDKRGRVETRKQEKRVLDVCCGGRMFWFDKRNPEALYLDSRRMEKQSIWKKGDQERFFEVDPDMVMDFRKLKIDAESFSLVVFDPPHLKTRNGKTGWMHKKYGSLNRETWKEDIRRGFSECFRVLKNNGVLVFKWSETEIPLREVLELTQQRPLFGHPSGKAQGTHWVAFIK